MPLIHLEMDPHPTICPLDKRLGVAIRGVEKHTVVFEWSLKHLDEIRRIPLQEKVGESDLQVLVLAVYSPEAFVIGTVGHWKSRTRDDTVFTFKVATAF